MAPTARMGKRTRLWVRILRLLFRFDESVIQEYDCYIARDPHLSTALGHTSGERLKGSVRSNRSPVEISLKGTGFVTLAANKADYHGRS